MGFTRRCADQTQSPGLPRQVPIGIVMMTEKDLQVFATAMIDPVFGLARV